MSSNTLFVLLVSSTAIIRFLSILITLLVTFLLSLSFLSSTGDTGLRTAYLYNTHHAGVARKEYT